MTAKGHFVFALASVVFAKKIGISPALAQGNWWHVVIGGALTCLLPDIDHPKSLIGRQVRCLSVIISKAFNHRGFTHSLLAIIVCRTLFISSLSSHLIIPLDLAHAMLVGYISHIFADMLTPAGVPLLWPCSWRFHVPILNSGKNNRREQMFCIFCLIWSILHPLDVEIITKLPISDLVKSIWKWVCGHLI